MKNSDSFFQQIYKVARLIPYGRVTSYGAIASYLGSPQAARIVGWAMNGAHSQKEFVPAHRVVNRNGVLSGKHHFSGSNVMEDLLKSEGINIEKDKIINLKKYFWDPFKELL